MKNVITNNTEYSDVTFSILPSGHGHFEVRTSFITPTGKSVSGSNITTDTELIDRLRDEDDSEAREIAGKRFIQSWLDSLTDEEYDALH